jgi:hypothetical protein
MLFFSSCKERNEVTVKVHDKVLYGMAPPPYATGTMARLFPPEMFDFLPPQRTSEKISFEDRIQYGFELALSRGLDICLALSSVTVAIGERFKQRSKNTRDFAVVSEPEQKSKDFNLMVPGSLIYGAEYYQALKLETELIKEFKGILEITKKAKRYGMYIEVAQISFRDSMIAKQRSGPLDPG